MHYKVSGLWKGAWFILTIPTEPLFCYYSYVLAFSFPFSPIVSLPNICGFHDDEVMRLIDLPI